MFEPMDLTVGVLELFAEQMALASRKALVATSESTPERVGGRPKLKLFGFGIWRRLEAQADFQWRREAKEQKALNERARLRAKSRREFFRSRERRKIASRGRFAKWLASLTPEERDTRRRRDAERHKRKRARANNLAAWKVSAPKTKARIAQQLSTPNTRRHEKRRAQRAAQAQRRRDRMTKEQRAAEVTMAQARRKAKRGS